MPAIPMARRARDLNPFLLAHPTGIGNGSPDD